MCRIESREGSAGNRDLRRAVFPRSVDAVDQVLVAVGALLYLGEMAAGDFKESLLHLNCGDVSDDLAAFDCEASFDKVDGVAVILLGANRPVSRDDNVSRGFDKGVHRVAGIVFDVPEVFRVGERFSVEVERDVRIDRQPLVKLYIVEELDGIAVCGAVDCRFELGEGGHFFDGAFLRYCFLICALLRDGRLSVIPCGFCQRNAGHSERRGQ